MLKVKDIRNILKNTKPCENGTIEIINASFIADEQSIFGKPNEYCERELAWYKSMSLNVKDIPGETPKIWLDVCDSNFTINSNYGWCIFSKDNHYQYINCLRTLINDKYSRRALMIYTRPAMQYDYIANNMNDFMCTNNVQVLIRDNKLHYIVNMRSNDAVFGYKNDKYWHDYVFNNLLIKIQHSYSDVVKGDMYWNVGSLHIYPRHFKLLLGE